MDLSTFLPTARVFSAEKVNCSKTDEKLEGGGGGGDFVTTKQSYNP